MSKKAAPLPMSVIRESLELDPDSKTWLRWKWRPREHFTSDRTCNMWNVRHGRNDAGSISRKSNKDKYFNISINGKVYRAHRVVMALISGSDPGNMQIDHIDGNGLNNDPANLRLATHTENLRNRGLLKSNTSGRRGVSWSKRENKWLASIRVNGQGRFLGLFADINDASFAYERAAREAFGEFYKEL